MEATDTTLLPGYDVVVLTLVGRAAVDAGGIFDQFHVARVKFFQIVLIFENRRQFKNENHMHLYEATTNSFESCWLWTLLE